MLSKRFRTASKPLRRPWGLRIHRFYRRLFPIAFAVFFLIVTIDSVTAQSSPSNPIVIENSQTGNPSSEWDISGSGDASIQGFATNISINKGGTVNFKVNTNATSYRLDIYRMGYYGGMGARKVTTIQGKPQQQPNCITDSTTGLVDCGNWTVSASWAVPNTATSGIYFARAVRSDTGGASHIFFIVRDDSSKSDLLFQTSDTTWQAYNFYGGNNLYGPEGNNGPDRAYKVSYNRPFTTRSDKVESWVFTAEYPMVRWLEANGYNVSYTTGVDSDQRGSLIKNHKVFLSVGHDEYWSALQRNNVEAARAAGVNLTFFSGNEVFWKTRWENSIDGTNTPYRTLVTYKETIANAKIDPSDPPTWTGTWRDPRFSPPADGGRPENALTGTLFMVNGPQYNDLTVSGADGKLRFWRNTQVSNLPAAQTVTLSSAILGYEWDAVVDNGFLPPGLFRLSSTTANVPSLLLDYGSSYGTGTATHSLTLYRYSSGALVFGSGTCQWSWGLDGNHDFGPAPASTPDVSMQQATVNLFADMGVQPAALQSGLTSAIASTDKVAPSSQLASPANGASLPTGGSLTISGTAVDAGGGVVAGVEVSVDGGTTWHPATGRESWSYSWTPTSSGSATIRSRAVDDSGNLETPTAGITITVGQGSGSSSSSSIWSNAAVPTTASQNDTQAVEVGVKFRSDVDGYITGIRFYKGSANTGTHIGNLWTSTGNNLATAIFTNETASGWQQVNFSTPVAISANTTYVASYHTDVGGYAVAQSYFANSGIDNPPLHFLANGVDGPNGVYQYGPSSFPTQSYQSSNYWVDVVFSSSAPSGSSSSIWSNAAVPTTASQNDTQAVELGVKFRSDVNGYITGIRFYKGSANTGTHIGNLWTSTGNNLATATFTNETVSGWQQVNFSTPVAISANTTYIASYHTNVGGYAVDRPYFANSGVDNPPLHALANGVDGANGVYQYGPSSFPTQSYQSSNYWVDVVFNNSTAHLSKLVRTLG